MTGEVRRSSNRGSVAAQHLEVACAIESEQKELARAKTRSLPCWVRVSRSIVDNVFFVAMTTVLTVWALVADDIRIMLTRKDADDAFDIVTWVAFAIFSLEIVLSCFGKQDYIGGFFFVMDIFATITLVFDNTKINEAIFQRDEESMEGMENSRAALVGARAARMVRVLRLIRILKLYKAVYEARQKAARKKQADHNPDEWEDDDGDDVTAAQESMAVESNLGKKLSDLTTRKCVILILTMMLVYPLLAPHNETYPEAETFGADLIQDAFSIYRTNRTAKAKWRYQQLLLRYIYYHNWFTVGGVWPVSDEACVDNARNCPAMWSRHVFWVGLTTMDMTTEGETLLASIASDASLSEGAVAEFESNLPQGEVLFGYGRFPNSAKKILESRWENECPASDGSVRWGISLLDERTAADTGELIECPEKLRRAERTKKYARLVTEDQLKAWHFAFYFDQRIIAKESAYFNFFVTIFIAGLLLVSSMMFSHDARELVLNPIENMMVKINMIRRSPLIAAKLTDAAFKAEEIEKAKKAKMDTNRWMVLFRKTARILICTASNTKRPQPSETAVLEKTIMKLGTLLALGFGEAGMNVISHNMQGQDSACIDAMVAGQTVDCMIGLARMGDFGTFTEVLQTRVMTFVNQVAEIIHGVVDANYGAPSRNTGDAFLCVWTLHACTPEMCTSLADFSLIAFVQILAAVNRSLTLAQFRTHPGLQQRLGRKLRVSLTFGLHHGWAIEGALGSEYKIDATYVSPNVSIAESAERAADLYKTSILLTEAFTAQLSRKLASYCRLIDRVIVRGSPKAMDIFVIDLNYMTLALETPVHIRWNTRQRFRARQHLEAEKQERLAGAAGVIQVSDLLDTDPDFIAMRSSYTVAFQQIFGMGYQNYSQGEWRTARRLLSRTCTQLGFVDGPSAALMRFMEKPYAFEAPPGWCGVHHLDDMPSRMKVVRV
eukprot:TRINITY_DN3951_c0_g1_i1.p1 TRINITY_DN3951_c0_g1~~TRINITY_DN3951_c0_g1_i1.p1  ORF type:complete len:949 (-),score=156.80 TRINITY_DN3951_c0_g1_i1:655-3501(-)